MQAGGRGKGRREEKVGGWGAFGWERLEVSSS
jgi:hypothetical protein